METINKEFVQILEKIHQIEVNIVSHVSLLVTMKKLTTFLYCLHLIDDNMGSFFA